MQMLREFPDLAREFDKYIAVSGNYDSAKWRAKFGGSRLFDYYLVSDYIDGYALSNPLLIADMTRDPDSYKEAVRDLAFLWTKEKGMVLGDRRADQYIIGHDKRAYGIDYQFMGDVGRWEKTKDSIKDELVKIPELLALFEREIKAPTNIIGKIIKNIIRGV
jgi:hypothetical protein